MKIIYNKFIPPKNFTAINVFGIIFARKEYKDLLQYEVNHERIHTAQMVELLGLLYYIVYFLEWMVRILQYKHPLKAYNNISFEREAYANHYNPEYIKTRKPFSFTNYYLKKKI